MFKKMPFVLLALIVLISLVGDWIPDQVQSLLYGLSLTIKSLIVFILPFIIFCLLFRTMVVLANRASGMILLILALVCVSNFLSTLVSYGWGSGIYGLDIALSFPQDKELLQPLGSFTFPKWIENNQALFAGLIFGLVGGWFLPKQSQKVSLLLESMTSKLLCLLLYVIPIFIAGFVLKMNYDQVMGYIIQNYALIFSMTALAVVIYIAFLYFLFNRPAKAIESIKNILPAAIAGFGSMSSAAAMPLTILGAEKNAKDPEMAQAIIPTTVNIHLIGDCFAIPIFAFAVLKSYGVEAPHFADYLTFALYFVLAKFSVAAIPGGGILVMLPILEAYLGFHGEMLSLITALYILFDPVITAANVMGNGAFAIGMEKIYQKTQFLSSRRSIWS